MSMVFAAALAIYGSNRIEVLRREAFKAANWASIS